MLLIAFDARPKESTNKSELVNQLIEIATKEPNTMIKVALAPLPILESLVTVALGANLTAVTLAVPTPVTTTSTVSVVAAST